MSQIIEAVKTAIQQTVPAVTTHLRTSAARSGWPVEATMGLSASATETGFQWSANDAAVDWEYGNVDRTPVPAARRALNRMDDVERALLENLAADLRQRGLL